MFRKFFIAALLILATSKVSFADTLARQSGLAGNSIAVTGTLLVAGASEAATEQLPATSAPSSAHGLFSTIAASGSAMADAFRSASESSSLLLLGSTFVGMGLLMRRRSQGSMTVTA